MHRCKTCHFLSKNYLEDHSGRELAFSLSEEDRERINRVPDRFYLSCHMGVWSEAVSPELKSSRENLICKKNRERKCFYLSHREGMLFKAAEEIQKREEEFYQLRKSNLYTRIGLWVAAGSMLISAAIELCKING